jgi:hypothetical protein
VSDFGAEPPPPPPPPNLAPPPGYAGYTANLSTTLPLRRVSGLAKAILILLAISVIGTIVQLIATPRVVDGAKDYLDGSITSDEFRDKLGAYGITSFVVGFARIALIVLSIIWLFRIIQNHRAIGRRLTWGPAWAIAGWVLPPLLYIIPTLVLAESWKAADPAVPPQDDSWKRDSVNPLLWAWFVLYSIAPIVLLAIDARSQVGMTGGNTRDVADSLDDKLGVLVAAGIVALLGTVAWALVVRAWTARHTRLTGEALAR